MTRSIALYVGILFIMMLVLVLSGTEAAFALVRHDWVTAALMGFVWVIIFKAFDVVDHSVSGAE